MNRLDNKVALVSGGARGIGGETAKRMAEAGARIVVGDILEDRDRLRLLGDGALGGVVDGEQAVAIHFRIDLRRRQRRVPE